MMKKSIKYDELVNMWIKDHKNFIKESTYANYKNIVDNHLIVDFSNKCLSDFDNTLLQNYVLKKCNSGSIKDKPLALKSVKDIMVILKLSLRYAFKKEYLKSFDLSVKYPKINSDSKIMIIDDKDVKKIISSVKKSSDSRDIGVLIALLMGLRIGEICALKYSDICFKSNTLFVNRTLQRIYTKDEKTKIIEASPKTSSSYRTIPLSVEFKNFLDMRYKNSSHYILSNSLKPVEPRLLRKRFNKILCDNKITHYKFHSLRHTFATKCIEAKIDYKTISVLLGHSNINTTLNLYVHPNNKQKKKAINKLTASLFK